MELLIAHKRYFFADPSCVQCRISHIPLQKLPKTCETVEKLLLEVTIDSCKYFNYFHLFFFLLMGNALSEKLFHFVTLNVLSTRFHQ